MSSNFVSSSVPPQQAATEKIRGDSMQGLLMRLDGGEGELVMACPGTIRCCVRSGPVKLGMRVAFARGWLRWRSKQHHNRQTRSAQLSSSRNAAVMMQSGGEVGA
jgi:hypothetical protein